MASLQDSALVLRRIPYRDTSFVVHFFTREHGFLAAMAKGVRANRPNGQRAALAGFHTLTIYYRLRSPDALATLTHAEITHPRHHLSGHALALAAGQLFLEVAYRFSQPGDPLPEVFDQLTLFLNALENGQDPVQISATGLGLLLRSLGYGWRIDRCAGCSRQTNLIFFSIKRGQGVCSPCGTPYAPHLYPLSPSLCHAMNHLPWPPQEHLLNQAETSQLYRMAMACLTLQSGRTIQTDEIFRRLAGI
ncbi:MAG: DNA repair protein RecO [Magnetococcus sp. DMHC-6]